MEKKIEYVTVLGHDPKVLLLSAYVLYPHPFTIDVFENGVKVEATITKINRHDLQRKYGNQKIDENCGFRLLYPLKNEHSKIEVYMHQTSTLLFKANDKKLQKLINKQSIRHALTAVNYTLQDDIEIYRIEGWAFSDRRNMDVEFYQSDTINTYPLDVNRFTMVDLNYKGIIPPDVKNCAFGLTVQVKKGQPAKLILKTADNRIETINLCKDMAKIGAKQVTNRPKRKLNLYTIHKGLAYLWHHGLKATLRKIKGEEMYQEWLKKHALSEQDIKSQREHVFVKKPLISIVVPVYNTDLNMLEEMIQSVYEQTYANWQLCLANASKDNISICRKLTKWANKDKRIVIKNLNCNEGIAQNTNQAIALAKGDFIAFLDHDDKLAINALYEMVVAYNQAEDDIYYSDEDKMSSDGKHFMLPHFKPDFSPDLLYSHNYITHFVIMKKTIIDELGGLSSACDGAQDYDLLLRAYEKTNRIKHIAKVLYHWRMFAQSTAANPESKLYTVKAGQKALQNHFDRQGIAVKVEAMPEPFLNFYHPVYQIKGQPKVSIIIPNKDHKELLKPCLKSLFHRNDYANIEILIVENNSTTEDIFNFYDHVSARHQNVRILKYEGDFNYSKINNFAVKEAKGEYLLFLNNDTELIDQDAIREMLGLCQRKDVGAVGAKLLYEDDSIQHAGVIVGIAGSAAHVFSLYDKNQFTYMHRSELDVDYSAVTAACMMVKKEDFLAVDGFSEDFKVAFNDVDLCLKLQHKLHKYVVYDGHAHWHHYESKSRGYEDTPAKKKRFEQERDKLQKKWPMYYEKGDPYYNPAFDLNMAPWQL